MVNIFSLDMLLSYRIYFLYEREIKIPTLNSLGAVLCQIVLKTIANSQRALLSPPTTMFLNTVLITCERSFAASCIAMDLFEFFNVVLAFTILTVFICQGRGEGAAGNFVVLTVIDYLLCYVLCI